MGDDLQLRRMLAADRTLIQIVDRAMDQAVRLSGPWLACHIGCTQCCMGPFPITQLDAIRLRQGLAELEAAEPERAARVRQRACEWLQQNAAAFPGDRVTGVLEEGPAAEARFETYADDERCPALDPETGACDLYLARPITCRTFGPPVRCEGETLGVCELCFQGAAETQIAACEVEIDPDGIEAALVEEIKETLGPRGLTIVAFALADAPPTSAYRT